MRASLVLVVACAANPAPRPACDVAARIAADERAIDAGERVDATVDEAARSPAQRRQVEEAAALMDRRDRPVDAHDLAILDRALVLLASEAVWDRADLRKCETPGKLSLFCALKQASIDVLGTYEHRRTGLQEVRFAVEDATVGRAYEHRLQDFNNDPATRFADVRAVVAVARAVVAARLAAQCPAAATR